MFEYADFIDHEDQIQFDNILVEAYSGAISQY